MNEGNSAISPKIKREIKTKREIMIESGHRCAVCGIPITFQEAYIVPWNKSKYNLKKSLICLCSICHFRADYGEKVLGKYKKKPWISKHRQNILKDLKVTNQIINIQVIIKLKELTEEETTTWIKYAIAAFLFTIPDQIIIKKEKQGDDLIIQITAKTNRKKINIKELSQYIYPLEIINSEILNSKELIEKENIKIPKIFIGYKIFFDIIINIIKLLLLSAVPLFLFFELFLPDIIPVTLTLPSMSDLLKVFELLFSWQGIIFLLCILFRKRIGIVIDKIFTVIKEGVRVKTKNVSFETGSKTVNLQPIKETIIENKESTIDRLIFDLKHDFQSFLERKRKEYDNE
ncbi:MAG: hypothetical protein JXB88_22495 [Spirochaetales bacterium]|nr:hypothetical protein [Spirochaetales bacterium]